MKLLVVAFDVSGFTPAEIENLRFAAAVQGEAEAGEYAHPDASALSRVVSDPIEVEAMERRLRRADAVVTQAIPGQLDLEGSEAS